MSAARRRGRARAAAAPVHVARTTGPRLLPDAALRAAVRAALEHGGRADCAVGLVLVGDAELAELHGRFLGDPSPTDVITFDLQGEVDPERSDLGTERSDLGTERSDLGTERSDLGTERSDLGTKRSDLDPERSDVDPERSDSDPDRGGIDPEHGDVEAEIYISVECAARVARRRGTSGARELALYAVHGALHLCGYDDHEPADRRRMRRAEARVLAGLGYGAVARTQRGRRANPR